MYLGRREATCKALRLGREEQRHCAPTAKEKKKQRTIKALMEDTSPTTHIDKRAKKRRRRLISMGPFCCDDGKETDQQTIQSAGDKAQSYETIRRKKTHRAEENKGEEDL